MSAVRQLRNPAMAKATGRESAELAAFAAELKFEHIPKEAVDRCVDFFVDWVGSALSGAGQRAILAMQEYADAMGPSDGRAEILASRRMTSPLFAAMLNAASSHISEQDDVHNGSVFHPAAVVFPTALAAAQHLGASGRDLVAASIAGYEVGIRIGEFLGRSHYRVFHTTGTAGTIAAAVTAGRILGLDRDAMLHAIGSAGTQAAGLWEFLRDAADSKQLHTAKAAGDGLMAAFLAKDGFTGARSILEGAQGMAAGMSSDADPARLTDLLGRRWAIMETSFKFHASCRHTHPAADALLGLVEAHDLKWQDIDRVTAHVHQAALDVLGPVARPATVHQAKFSMPATLGLIAVHRRAGMAEFDRVLEDEPVLALGGRIEMELDAGVEDAYPRRWIGKVSVRTKDGRLLAYRVDQPKGDPGNTLSRAEIDAKARRLALYGKTVGEAELAGLLAGLWSVAEKERMGRLLRKRRMERPAEQEDEG